ncbi:sugar phosphate isomerase/epimerase family protein [Portibacter lacus]|uniref:Sugar phosphate isomerase n=1 Tax=Portibacter lacus TaxID=1099794 RepID=A0AA37WGL7_9BACT|nr:sugar phosphate isomerase/epimerase [Portibacter lacus]GLR20008.1 sugar phosphate isomerase [Portibacter lacus]
MNTNRRKFLRQGGQFAAGLMILPALACKQTKVIGGNAITGDLDRFGIQLYTLRDQMPKDPKGVLRKLSTYGYNTIESYEGKQGMFWGMTNKEFKSYMDELGMKIVSSHMNIDNDLQRKAAEAAEIGMDYVICPYIGPQKSMDAWKGVCDKFNKAGEICKKEGIKFAYHNHAYSFKAFSGMIPHDYLMDNTDADLVKHEMDIYWVVTGGADPIDYLKKYSGRFTLCHVKDRLKTATADETDATCVVGTGMIDFPKILKVAKENGMEHFILEQERYDNTTSLGAAEAGAKYLQKFKYA